LNQQSPAGLWERISLASKSQSESKGDDEFSCKAYADQERLTSVEIFKVLYKVEEPKLKKGYSVQQLQVSKTPTPRYQAFSICGVFDTIKHFHIHVWGIHNYSKCLNLRKDHLTVVYCWTIL
jgi:hypothetical protein